PNRSIANTLSEDHLDEPSRRGSVNRLPPCEGIDRTSAQGPPGPCRRGSSATAPPIDERSGWMGRSRRGGDHGAGEAGEGRCLRAPGREVVGSELPLL